jgi:hypothetical protein
MGQFSVEICPEVGQFSMKLNSGRTVPIARHDIRRLSADTLDSAQNVTKPGPSKQKRPRRTVFNRLIFLKKFGAGEGIRTLDPNLGKVVLYP